MRDTGERFSEAVDLAELGRYEEALVRFRALLKTDSNNAAIWNHIGIIRFRQGEYRDALNAFGQAADIDPAGTSARFNKSLALVRLGNDTGALRALDKVLAVSPYDHEALSQRALIVARLARAGEEKRPDPGPVQTHLRV
ncbi:MAG: tetratricopeptide repeat protein [Methanoregula sp.]|jgi:tetratricopeptide (TPR) repeat protein|nr:tetratricopeptide repeat protein [Methanoregula sp.]